MTDRTQLRIPDERENRFPSDIVLPGTPGFDELLAALRYDASRRDRDRVLPFEAVATLRRARIGALRLPTAEGGGGLSLRALFEAVIELAAAEPNVTHILRNHFAFVERFAQPWSGPRCRRWMRLVAAGTIVGLAAGEESNQPLGGAAMETRLVPDGDGWRVTGRKSYSTGCLFADHISTRAQADGDAATLVVPADREGVTLIDDWNGMGQRLTGSGTTVLDNVRVEPDEILFEKDAPELFLPFGTTLGHLFLTAVIAGIVRNVHEDAAALLKNRKRTFAHAPSQNASDDPLLQATLGEIGGAAFATRAVVLLAAEALDRSSQARGAGAFDPELAHQAAEATANAKVVVDGLALKAASRLFDVAGASATGRDLNLDRHWRNARTLISHNPTAYKAMALGAHALKGERFLDRGFF